jgi:Family of unknown function (DUF6065)
MKITAYKNETTRSHIEQTKVKRDWMDETSDAHAYKCFPVSLANTVGWSISFLDDIEFVWDGISDTTSDHVKIISDPGNVCSTQRANATISFYSGIFFDSGPDVSLLQIVPPNFFVDGATPFTTIISTSVLKDAIPIAWKITRPDTIIKIPAGMPVATFIPISLSKYQDVELDIKKKVFEDYDWEARDEKLKVWEEISKKGGFTNFYRDAVDYLGNSLGRHEVKSLKLKINDFTSSKEK